jgi:hypothetical protein
MVPDMTNDSGPNDDRHPSADSAFVVHLVATGTDAPEVVRGRVEHISSGRWTRFTSVAELIGFMRQTLALAATDDERAAAGLPSICHGIVRSDEH